jgi:hypothetical protein
MNTLTCTRYEQPEASQSRGPAWRRISRLVLAVCVLLASQPGGLQPAPARAESPAAPSAAPAGGTVTAASLGRLPRYFVENRGQVAGDTAYTFRANGILPNTKKDAFVAVLNPFGSAFAYSSFLGGHELDRGTGIAVAAPGVIYLAGMTSSDGSLGAAAAFPTTAAAWNATLQGTLDGFAAKLLIGADLTVDVTDLLDPVVLVSGAGGIAHYRVDIKNLGPQLATGVHVPITFDGKVEKTVVSAHLVPPGIGTCSIIVQQWVSCTFGLLNPGDTPTVLVNVK